MENDLEKLEISVIALAKDKLNEIDKMLAGAGVRPMDWAKVLGEHYKIDKIIPLEIFGAHELGKALNDGYLMGDFVAELNNSLTIEQHEEFIGLLRASLGQRVKDQIAIQSEVLAKQQEIVNRLHNIHQSINY